MPKVVYDVTGWHDVGLEAYHAFEDLEAAKTLGDQAEAWIRMRDAMSDLVSWLPGWDWEHGVLNDPRSEIND